MKNSDYWKQRMEILQNAQMNKGEKYLEELDRQYKIATKNIESEISMWYYRFSVNNKITMTEAKQLLSTKDLEEFKWNVQEYIKYGEENSFNQKWMKELENASARIHISRLEALKLQLQQQVEVLYGNQTDDIDSLIHTIYSDGYYHTAFEIQKGFNVGYDLHAINTNQLDKLISRPWTLDGKTFSDRLWTNKNQLIGDLQTYLTQSVITGKGPDQIIKAISEKFKTDRRKAGKLVMTESAAFASAAQKDAFNELDVEQFEIVATLDRRTSEICQDLDGEVFDMKDYAVGVTAPPFHVWCRSTTVPYFDDNFGERAARGADGKTYYVPSDMKYLEWKKAFVDGGSKDSLNIVSISDIIAPKTFVEKIQDIKDLIQVNGGNITESDVQNVGRIIYDELKLKRVDLKSELDNLIKKRDELGFEEIKRELQLLTSVQRGLREPKDFGYNNIDEVVEKIKELNLKKDEVLPRFEEIKREIFVASAKYKGSVKVNAEELRQKLLEIRSIGSESNDLNKHLNNSRSPMKKVIIEAYEYYPTEWIDKSVIYGNLTPKKVNRGYYSHLAEEIALSGYDDNDLLKTAIHELGHRFERTVPNLLDAEKVFYERRTAGEELQWLGGAYARDEKSRFDKFISKYMGKDYKGKSYELASMGFEYAYTQPTKLWEDEDYATWIYGLLALY